jgi:selenocysteine lyase/cysteine desulfurase
VAKYINADPAEVVLGPSTTQLFRNLSLALYDHIQPDDEIVISKLDHEANIASWITLAEWRGARIVWWEGENDESKTNPKLTPASLAPLLSSKTKLVTATHTSNILGTITDVRALADIIHEKSSALLCVDAVAYAPHRAIDVRLLGADIYCFSWYKLYGPHMASMYVSSSAQERALKTIGHFFKPTATLENKLGLAGANYELTASIPDVVEYLAKTPWEAIAAHEEVLQGVLIEYLKSKPEVFTIWGERVADRERRVPVVSFTVKGRGSKGVVDAIEAKSDFACRWGAFYSNRLCEEVLGLDPVDGVVRVSLLHYNTGEFLDCPSFLAVLLHRVHSIPMESLLTLRQRRRSESMSRFLTRLYLCSYSCSESINVRPTSASCLTVVACVSHQTVASGDNPIEFSSQLKRFYEVGISRIWRGTCLLSSILLADCGDGRGDSKPL